MITAVVLLIAGVPFAAPFPGQETEPFRVQARIAAATYYPGQATELTVGVVAGDERPEIRAPVVAEASVTPAGTSFRPISASAIGDLVAERNLYVARFRIIATRPGPLVVPPVVARLKERSGRSEPVRLTIARLPDDRPGEFLGGVGTFELTAEVSPATVRSGQEFEYRIGVKGTAARGMTENPLLGRFRKVPLGLRIEPLPSELVQDPPSRIFRFRVRPTKAGEATLPPVAITAFDPAIKRYVTRVTPGVPVRVLDLPKYNPATLSYATSSGSGDSVRGQLIGWAIGISSGLLAASIGALLLARRIRVRRGRAWLARRLLARLQCELEKVKDSADAGRRVTEGTAAYLRIIAGRPPGALTPLEAQHAIAESTGAQPLAARVERLIGLCDRAQFAESDSVLDELIAEARMLFGELEQLELREERAGEGLANELTGNTGRGSQGRPDGIDGVLNLPLRNASQESHRQLTTDTSVLRD